MQNTAKSESQKVNSAEQIRFQTHITNLMFQLSQMWKAPLRLRTQLKRILIDGKIRAEFVRLF